MKKKIIAGILAVLTSITLIGCGTNSSSENTNENNNEKVKVMVSIYPLKEFADKIAGDKAEKSALYR